MGSISWLQGALQGFQPDRRRRKRYTLAVVTWIWLVFSLFTLLLSIQGTLSRALVDQRLIQENINRTLNQADNTFSARWNQMTFLANWLPNDERFGAMVRARDRIGLQGFLVRTRELDSSLIPTVWDNQKALLADYRDSAVPYPPSEGLSDILSQVLTGQVRESLGVDSTGRASAFLVRPLYDPTSGQILGALSIGFWLDDGWLDRLPKIRDDQQVIVLSGNQVVFARLDNENGVPLAGRPASGDLLRTQNQTEATVFFPVNTLQGSYQFKFIRISAPALPSVVMLGIGVTAPSLGDYAGYVLNPTSLLILTLLAGMAATGYLYLKSLQASLLYLHTEMQRMAAGDLSTRIITDRRDELGSLAGELDRVRIKCLMELDQAHANERDYAAALKGMGVAAMQTDFMGHIRWVNPAAEILLNETQADLAGRSWRSLFMIGSVASSSIAQQQEVSAVDVDRIAGPATHIVNQLRLRSDTQQCVSVISSPIPNDKGISGFVHILLESSAQEELQRSRDEFMMHAAHELRGPIGKLRTSIELLSETFPEDKSEQGHSLVENMHRTIIQFQFFVENLIDMRRIQSGRFSVHPVKTDFHRILRSVLQLFMPFSQANRHEIEMHLDLPSPCAVMADSQTIIQVMFNLLFNATKYGGKGKPVQITAFIREKFLVTEVTDFGPGISREEQPRIFDRFYRGKRVETEGMGLGLGLAIARTIIHQHGGEIDVRSEEGAGSTFWFSLPIVG